MADEDTLPGFWIVLALVMILGVGAGTYSLFEWIGGGVTAAAENADDAPVVDSVEVGLAGSAIPAAVPEPPAAAPAVQADIAAAPAPVALEDGPDLAAPAQDDPAAADSAESELSNAEVAGASPLAPVFDTFRVEPDGSMLVAGRAEPGQRVDIILSGDVIDSVVADGSGGFVSFATAGASDGPRSLSLIADPEGQAIRSATSFLVAPIAKSASLFARAQEPGLPASPEATGTPPVTAETDQNLPTDSPADGLAVADLAPDTVQLPPTVLQADADGIRVVQSSPEVQQEAPNVALDAITYDPTGDVQLSGRAVGDGAVQVYIDNRPVIASPVTAGGDWQIELPDIDTGVYTLRIDELNDDGGVVSRLETPFRREEPEDVAAVLAEETAQEGFDVAVRTVQPGATLWAIAEENLGDGIFYVAVFEANRDLIKDPDLIYPGQIFRIPEVDAQ